MKGRAGPKETRTRSYGFGEPRSGLFGAIVRGFGEPRSGLFGAIVRGFGEPRSGLFGAIVRGFGEPRSGLFGAIVRSDPLLANDIAMLVARISNIVTAKDPMRFTVRRVFFVIVNLLQKYLIVVKEFCFRILRPL